MKEIKMENKISIEILAHKLLGSDQKEHCLNDYKGKYIVLYFYPMDNTPGCTIQGHKYTELLSKFEELNAVVIGNRFNVSNIVVGEDFKFGKNRAGNLTDLESFFNVYKLKLTTIGNDIVSTSEIIQNIKDADFEIANKKLGRRYDVIGKVVKGKQLGRKLGFPTANLSFKDEYMIPKVGIYAGYA
uniref:riboflavin kinase n=1 Tax=Biomphalaria glabrata TaxID=6526 RepID=A0A2C9LUB1_BIOGL